jgi:uncharacterized protein (DUF1015 family)
MLAEGVLIRDANPYYYAYRCTWTGGRQTGLACVASLDAYAGGRIRKHEPTTPSKLTDRVKHIEALDAQTSPVTMAYAHAPEIDTLLKRVTERDPDVAVTTDDDATHELWVINDAAVIGEFTRRFNALPALYIADGHHLAAAAARLAAERQGEGSHSYVLSVVFPHHEMTLLDCDRVVRDLNGRTPEQLLAEIGERYAATPSSSPVRPASAAEVGMFLSGRWYQLKLRSDLVPRADPIGRLPITLIARNLIEPILGIANPGTDRRIDFVAGGRGLAELERRVVSGEMAVAFALYPTTMDDLMAVADVGATMPPNSIWFEPKLADGMLSRVLD